MLISYFNRYYSHDGRQQLGRHWQFRDLWDCRRGSIKQNNQNLGGNRLPIYYEVLYILGVGDKAQKNCELLQYMNTSLIVVFQTGRL